MYFKENLASSERMDNLYILEAEFIRRWGNKETRKQFIVTIGIYISVELKVLLQAYIKTKVFQATT